MGASLVIRRSSRRKAAGRRGQIGCVNRLPRPSVLSKFRPKSAGEGGFRRQPHSVRDDGGELVHVGEHRSGADHTATSKRPEFFDTGTIAQNGGQGSVTIDAAGTFGYHCIFDSAMVARVRAPIVLSASSTTVGTAVSVIAATSGASSRFTYDYARKFGSGSWVVFKNDDLGRADPVHAEKGRHVPVPVSRLQLEGQAQRLVATGDAHRFGGVAV